MCTLLTARSDCAGANKCDNVAISGELSVHIYLVIDSLAGLLISADQALEGVFRASFYILCDIHKGIAACKEEGEGELITIHTNTTTTDKWGRAVQLIIIITSICICI